MSLNSKVIFYQRSPLKRVFDVVAGSFLSVAALPVMLVVGIAIGVTDGWPVLFFQKRMGQNKRIFTMVKFRTMYLGAEIDQEKYAKQNQAPKPLFKMVDDPRFVGIGKWLSITGLDELPQLWHVMSGEMSLVGPRPLPVAEAQKLSPAWDFRWEIKPGLFGETHLFLKELDFKPTQIKAFFHKVSASPFAELRFILSTMIKQSQKL